MLGFSLSMEGFPGCAVNWIAFIVPASNPVLGETIRLILAHPPTLGQQLLVKVEKCVEVTSGSIFVLIL